ncbi:MAG: DNA polymerase IV [Candidatus Thalassarchaeaceae archaeon]|nr:DNA polymerase IV [Candidatus Thalassarchaeaceae archaeon]
MGERILIHCDLDAFFASVETIHQNLDPTLPLIIGSDPKKGLGRGIVSTCNYAAREYGIRSAMPISEAWRRCPGSPVGNGIYLRSRFRLYRRASKRVMRILYSNADKFERASIDEAYLDVTERCDGDWDKAFLLAQKMQSDILDDIQLSASFGIGPTRIIAKMASEQRKPGGIFLVPSGGFQQFFEPHPCRAVPGIGKKAAQLLGEMGVMTLSDAYEEGPDSLIQYLGQRRGENLWAILEGRSSNEVSTLRTRKSISKEKTFQHDQKNVEVVFHSLDTLIEKISNKLLQLEITARNVEVKIRYKGFETFTHARSLPVSMDDIDVFRRIATRLLTELYDADRPVRLIGFKLGDLEAPPNRQSTLDRFHEEE